MAITYWKTIKLALTMLSHFKLRKIAISASVFRGQILIFHATLSSVFRYSNEEKHHGRSQKQSSTQGCG
jgi:hypothetical protein